MYSLGSLSWQVLDASLTPTDSHSYSYGVGNRLETVDGTALAWDDLDGISQDQRGFTIGRFPDGSASSITVPTTVASGLTDVLDNPVTLPGDTLAVDIIRDAGGLPVRWYQARADGGPADAHTRVWGNPEGDWPFAGVWLSA